jgi:putative methyltransferase (TIGR04325 family)
MVAPPSLKALLRLLTPPKLLSTAGGTASTAKPPADSEWAKLDAWPNIRSTWAYVLGEGNSAIEKAREEDRNAEEQGFTAPQPSEVVRAYMLAFAFAAARAADGKTSLSVLDFGGGLGLYSTVARLALANKSVDYTVQELPAIAKAGALARPSVRFISDEQQLAAAYDLVFAQGSLQYIKNWREQLAKLAARSASLLFLSRVLVLRTSATAIVHQRIPGDQFAFWCWNEAELLDFAASIGLALVQTIQFRDAYAPIVGLEELSKMCGYLFRRSTLVGCGGPAASGNLQIN